MVTGAWDPTSPNSAEMWGALAKSERRLAKAVSQRLSAKNCQRKASVASADGAEAEEDDDAHGIGSVDGLEFGSGGIERDLRAEGGEQV